MQFLEVKGKKKLFSRWNPAKCPCNYQRSYPSGYIWSPPRYKTCPHSHTHTQTSVMRPAGTQSDHRWGHTSPPSPSIQKQELLCSSQKTMFICVDSCLMGKQCYCQILRGRESLEPWWLSLQPHPNLIATAPHSILFTRSLLFHLLLRDWVSTCFGNTVARCGYNAKKWH